MKHYSEFILGDMLLLYDLDEADCVSMSMILWRVMHERRNRSCRRTPGPGKPSAGWIFRRMRRKPQSAMCAWTKNWATA